MRYVLTAVALLLVVATLAGLKGAQIARLMEYGEEAERAGPPPEVVGTAIAEQQTWEVTLSAVASIATGRGVALSNDTPGIVSRLHFESGASVKTGQLLVELDSDVERAQLRALQARRDLAERNLNRSRYLVSTGAIPQAQLDNDEAAFTSQAAEVKALVEQIERKRVRAPFSGKIGIREVNLGQYLAPGTRIAVLEADEPEYVDFTLPQQHLSSLARGMPVRALDSTGALLVEGSISAIDPAIDPITRSVRVRASLPEDDRLRPGMFVQVEVVLPQRADVVTIPLTAVLRAPYGDSVFLAEPRPAPEGAPQKVARQVFVRVGETRGDFVSILEGITPGQEVVVAGAFKLRNDIPLIVDNSVAPEPQLDPRPEDR
ncbi:MAG: efflux RND transporter periplasmic adaptor subunit [Myxococcales bacterium]|nr:efflux RND transporter periplasmic adaptor subunit [Myxococcales bacterium]